MPSHLSGPTATTAWATLIGFPNCSQLGRVINTPRPLPRHTPGLWRGSGGKQQLFFVLTATMDSTLPRAYAAAGPQGWCNRSTAGVDCQGPIISASSSSGHRKPS